MKNRHILLFWLPFLLTLIGCVAATGNAESIEPMSTPTTSPFFAEREGTEVAIVPTPGDAEGIPTVASLFGTRVKSTPKPTSTPLPTLPLRQPVLGQTDVFTATIFTDELNENWDIVGRTGMNIDLSSSGRVFAGQRSIAYTPESAFSTLFFAVKSTTTEAYPFQQVLGVNFWLNGGDNYIQLDELAISVIGSNRYRYWVADDDSVEFPQGESFSETRLYFTGLNRSIPPETWVQVYLPMDTLIFDPEYQNVVGFYLKNDVNFSNTIYVDAISLIMLEAPENTVPATATTIPTASSTPTPTLTVQITPETTLTATTTVEQDTTPVTVTPTDTETEACVVSPLTSWELYTIQTGDTLSKLAFERGESTETVLDVNCLETGAVLSLGQEIWLPPLVP